MRHGGADIRAGSRAASARPRSHDGDAGRGASWPGHAGGFGGARRRRRRAARARGRPRFGGPVLPARRVRRRGGALDRAAGRARPRGHLRQGTVGRRGQARGRTRHRGRGRRTAGAVGAALQTGQPRLRAPRRPRRPAVRLRHRPVRPRAIHRRPHPRHDQHRGRGVPRAGVLGVQRRGRRTASPDDSGARRPARTPGVDRPVGHLRRAARQRRRRPRRRAPGVGAATAPRGRHPSAADRCAPQARVRRNHLAAAGIGAAGRRRRGHPARRRGAGGPHHVAAGGRPVDAHGASTGTARPDRRGRRTSARSRASWASRPTGAPR